MTPIQHLQLIAQAAEAALLSGPDRDRVRQSIQELAKILQPAVDTVHKALPGEAPNVPS